MQSAGPVHRHMRRMLRGILGGLDYDSFVDVGCGKGHNMALLRRGHTITRATGVDVSAQALAEARASMKDADFHQLDVQVAALPGRWDLVFTSLLLEHVPDDEAALRNMRAMTGRFLVAVTIAGDFERHRRWDERVGHVRNYAVGELEEKLGRAGFQVEKSIYWGFPFYSPLVRGLQERSTAGTGRFGAPARAAAEMLFWLYFLNSKRRGDLLIAVAHPA